MAGDLKGLTVTIGGNTTGLGKALDAIKTKTSGATKELKQIDRLLKMDPGNTDLLAQKQTVLASKIAATKEKLEVLKQAQEQAAQAFAEGKISESDYRKIERDVIAAQQELRKLEQDAEKTGEALNSSGKKGAEGAKKTAEAEKDVGNEAKTAEGKVSSFGDVLKGTLAAQVIVNGARAIARGIKSIFTGVSESAQGLGELSDNAEKVAMSAETLQSWQYAAKMVGFENEQLVKTMEKQQKAFSNAKTGSQSLIDSYAAIGVDISKINRSEDAFEVTISALAECHDETLRNAIANDIFGKSYADLAPLLNMGADGISKMRQEAYDLGLVVSNDAVAAGDEFADTIDTIGMQVDTAKAKLVSGMVPALQQYSKALEKSLSSDKTQKQLEKTGEAIGELSAKALGVASKALPILGDTFAFVTQNGKELAVAAAAAVVAIKGFSIVSKAKYLVAGLTASIRGLNAAIASNPIGAALTAVAALISMLAALKIAADEAREEQDALAESFRNAADSAAESQRKRAEAAQSIQGEFDHYRDLVSELDSIVDANGRVKEGYEDRAAYITGELSGATDTEIEIIDGTIQKYDELAASIDAVLMKKQAEAYLSANQGNYDSAKAEISSMETDEDGNYAAGSQAAAEQTRQTYNRAKQLQAELDVLRNSYNQVEADFTNGLISEAEATAKKNDIFMQISNKMTEISAELGTDLGLEEFDQYVADTKQIADDAAYAYDQNKAIIEQYEGVQSAVWADDAEAIGAAIETASNAQMTAANATLSSLEMQRDAAIEEYNQYLEWSQQEGSSVTGEEVAAKREAAVQATLETYKKMIADSDNYTQEELDSAKNNLENQLTELTGKSQDEIAKMIQETEADARQAGEHYVNGVVAGVSGNSDSAYRAGYNLGKDLDQGFRDGTEVASPSKVARRSAAWYPIGAALGIDDEADKPVNAAKRMAERINNAMSGGMSVPVLDFGAWGGNLNRYQQTTISGLPTDLSGIFDRLERIRASVDRIDPCINMDGQRVSGMIAGYTDADLGRRAAAAERGKLA